MGLITPRKPPIEPEMRLPHRRPGGPVPDGARGYAPRGTIGAVYIPGIPSRSKPPGEKCPVAPAPARIFEVPGAGRRRSSGPLLKAQERAGPAPPPREHNPPHLPRPSPRGRARLSSGRGARGPPPSIPSNDLNPSPGARPPNGAGDALFPPPSKRSLRRGFYRPEKGGATGVGPRTR